MKEEGELVVEEVEEDEEKEEEEEVHTLTMYPSQLIIE